MYIYTIIGSEIGYIGGNYKNDKPLLAANKAGKALFKKLEDVKYVKYKNKKSIKFVLKNKKDKINYCYEVFKIKNKKEFNYEIKKCVLSKNQLKKYIGGMDGSDSYSYSPSPSNSPNSSRSPTPPAQVARLRRDAALYMQQEGYSANDPPPFPEHMLYYINLEQGLRWHPGYHNEGTWILTHLSPPQIVPPYIRDNYYHNDGFIPSSWNEVYYSNYDDINNNGMLYDPNTYEFYYRGEEGHSTDYYSSDQSDTGTSSEQSRESTPLRVFQGGSIRRSFNAIKKLNHQIQKKHK